MGRQFSVAATYVLDEDSWALELREETPASDPGPATAAGCHEVVQSFWLSALIPDEDPDLPPSIHFHAQAGQSLPYEIVRWFMESVGAEVARCRAEMDRAKP